MTYTCTYQTPAPFSDMVMNSDGDCLTGLWFEGSKDASKHDPDGETKDLPIFCETCRWLDLYFGGNVPDFTPPYKIQNLTPFRGEVSQIMTTIPYGSTLTYNDIAKLIAKRRGMAKMSAQAVGGAVGWNPICLIIPCHRVIGANGNLTGYGGGLQNKIELLKLEGIDLKK